MTRVEKIMISSQALCHRSQGFVRIVISTALSFYGSKMILDRPNHFGRVPIMGSICFGRVQIILDRSKL